MSEEQDNANAFMLAVTAVGMSSLDIVSQYKAILSLAKNELEEDK